MAKASKGDGEKGTDPDFGSSDEDDDDEEKYADAADAVGQKLDTKTRITVRNLRIREDTAKYLINLDPESAYYDPKTRSMRDAPDKNVPPEDVSSRLYILWSVIDLSCSRNLPVTISSGSLVRHQRFRSFSCLLGKLPNEEMTFI